MKDQRRIRRETNRVVKKYAAPKIYALNAHADTEFQDLSKKANRALRRISQRIKNRPAKMLAHFARIGATCIND